MLPQSTKNDTISLFLDELHSQVRSKYTNYIFKQISLHSNTIL
jgi:hypothetical protein